MSKRQAEKKRSLDALGKIASSLGTLPAPKAAHRPPPAPVRPPAAPPKPPKRAVTAADVARQKQMAERREKLAEEKALRDRRGSELARSSNLAWRGMGLTDVPASIRRTGFDRDEPSVAQKITDVLGDARVKEGREKAKQKGKRAGGRG